MLYTHKEREILFAEHSWILNAKKAPNVSLGETVKARLKQFSVMNKLKKRALRVLILLNHADWFSI